MATVLLYISPLTVTALQVNCVPLRSLESGVKTSSTVGNVLLTIVVPMPVSYHKIELILRTVEQRRVATKPVMKVLSWPVTVRATRINR